MIFNFYFCREGANGGWAGCGGAARWTRSGANEELKKEEKESTNRQSDLQDFLACCDERPWLEMGASQDAAEMGSMEKEVPEGTVQKKGGEEEKKIQDGEVQKKIKLSTVANPPTSHLELQQILQRVATPLF